METKNKINTEKKNVQNVDLLKELNETNKEINVNNTIKDKYNFPDDFINRPSNDKQKRNYRNKLRKISRSFLSIDNPSKEEKIKFEKFLKTFFKYFETFEKIKANEIISFHNEKEEQKANEILKKYKAIK